MFSISLYVNIFLSNSLLYAFNFLLSLVIAFVPASYILLSHKHPFLIYKEVYHFILIILTIPEINYVL